MIFTCKRCGYTTKYKHVLIQHLEKKKICDPKLNDIDVNDLIAECKEQAQKTYSCICGKSFKHEPSLYRHKRTCVMHTDIEKNRSLIEELQEKILSVEKEICHLKSQSKNEPSQPHIIGDNNNVNSTVNNNTYVVVVNNFGSEDVSHVVEDQKFLDDCLKTLQIGIPNVVKKIYYDESKPENKTVVLKSAKRKTALVHNDGKWEEKDLNQVVPLMVRKGSRILSNHLSTKNISDEDSDKQEDSLVKHEYIADIVTQKKPEYDIISSAVKANIYNHR